jgi:hypothetical protein
VIDIVTTRRANLHAEIMQALGRAEVTVIPTEQLLSAVAYRPIVRDGQEQIEAWPVPLELAQSLPELPLALNAEIVVPVDLEATYTIACQRRRLA